MERQPGAIPRRILLAVVEQAGAVDGIEGVQHGVPVIGRASHPKHSIACTVRRNSRVAG